VKNKVILGLRLIAAAILMQTLFFKFTGAPESKYIFTTLGVEPWGRWFAGASELVASILLLVPMTQIFGALMAIGIMLGALLSHVFVLGLGVQDDGGLLFSLACVVLICSVLVVFLRREEISVLISKTKQRFALSK
jgi:putative oxidoreductase